MSVFTEYNLGIFNCHHMYLVSRVQAGGGSDHRHHCGLPPRPRVLRLHPQLLPLQVPHQQVEA